MEMLKELTCLRLVMSSMFGLALVVLVSFYRPTKQKSWMRRWQTNLLVRIHYRQYLIVIKRFLLELHSGRYFVNPS